MTNPVCGQALVREQHCFTTARTTEVGQGYRMPVMDRGLVDVLLRIRRRISAKEGNRGNTLCRFDWAGMLVGMLTGAGEGCCSDRISRSDRVSERI